MIPPWCGEAELPGIYGREEGNPLLQRLRSIQAEVLAVPQPDHLYHLRQTNSQTCRQY